MPPPEAIAARVGDVVTVRVPSWEIAGFVWSANFDRSALKVIDSMTIGKSNMAASRDTVFRFELLAPRASLQMVLGRPGQVPRQTVAYIFGQIEGD